MILKVYFDDLGFPVYEEAVERVDEELMRELVEKRVIKISDNCLLELI